MLAHPYLRWTLPLLIAGLLVGCSLDPADCAICNAGRSTDSGETATPPAAGELGGACLAGGTCGEGLACVEDVCVPDSTPDKLLIFHNNLGPMCLAAVNWLEDAQDQYSTLIVEEHLTTETSELELLRQLEDQYSGSEGVSTSFEYLPIIFFKGRAFSGFDGEVQAGLEALLQPDDGEIP